MSLLKKQNKFEESMKAKLSELETKPSDSLWAKMEKELDTDSFEHSFRNKFEDFSIPVSDKTWNQIEAQLPQEKNKKRILAFWFTGIFILASGLGFFASRTYYNSELLNEQSFHQQNPESAQKSTLNKEDQSTTQDVASYSAQSVNSNKNRETPNGNTSNQESNQPETLSGALISINGTEVSTILPNASRNSKFVPSTKHSNRNRNLGLVLASAGPTPNVSNSNNPGTPDALSVKPGEIKTAESNNSAMPNAAKSPESSGRQLTETSETIKLEDAHIKFDKDSIQRTSEANAENYSSEDDKLGKFSITAIAGLARTEMLLSKPSSSVYDLNKAFDLRTKLEKASLDWSGGFLLNYHIGEKWMISSGVQISNFKQALHYDLAVPEADSFHQIQSQNLYLHPTDSIIEGHVKTLDNKYSFTEIPLWITYSTRTDKKLGFDFMFGYSFALLTSVNAYMPDPACVGLLNVNDKASFPTIKGTSFFNFSPALNYKINSTVQLGLMPHVKLGLSSVINNSNWIQEKPLAIGLNFYLRKRF